MAHKRLLPISHFEVDKTFHDDYIFKKGLTRFGKSQIIYAYFGWSPRFILDVSC